jgi:hypothetical protein
MYVTIIFNSNIRATNTKKYTTLQPKLFVIHLLLLVGVLIVGLILFSQVLTSTIAAANTATEMRDLEVEHKDIKQELEPNGTEEIEEEDGDNTVKQEEEEEQESNDDTAGTLLEEHNIIIENNYTSYDSPFDLPFDNMVPFP